MALKIAHICIFEVDLINQLYTFFENSEAIFGVSGDTILQDVQPYSKLSPAEYQKAASAYFSHPDDAEVINKAFSSILSGKPATYLARMKAGDTNFIWCKIDVAPVLKEGLPVKMIGVITDINKMKSQMDDLQKRAHFDGLTGLYLKQYAETQIQTLLSQFPSQRHALLLMDLDNFKALNDTYGHLAGDQILRRIGDLLKRTFRNSDILSRFGGDEFIIFIRNLDTCKNFLSKLDLLLQSTEDDYAITKSIGISFFPEDGDSYLSLFESADKALYEAKKKRNSYSFFSDFQPTE